MNAQQFKRNIGGRVQLVPSARRFDESRAELPRNDDDWVIADVTEDRIRIENPRTGHFVWLGKDHIRNYATNPQREWDGLKHGFLNLHVQIFLQGREARYEPLWPAFS